MFPFGLPNVRCNSVDKSLIKMIRMNIASTKGEELHRAAVYDKDIKLKIISHKDN